MPGFKHGAGIAEKALTAGADFTGAAAAQELAVRDELETDGLDSITARGAVRLQTVADLYYQAILGVTDIEMLDVLVKRFGWIQNSALRAWQLVKDEKRRRSVIDVNEVISTLKGGDDGEIS